MNKNLKETKIYSKAVFKGSFLKVYKDKVLLPNNKTSTREWIKHPGAVCIIPILSENKILLIRQYRYPVKQEMIELPAGKIDNKEKSINCAKRELEEETGYYSDNLKLLTKIHPAIGFANEVMDMYVAKNLLKTKRNLDEDEFLELMPTKISDAIDMVWNGKITDVKTIIGILWAERIVN